MRLLPRALLAAALAVPAAAQTELDFTNVVDLNVAPIPLGSYVDVVTSIEFGVLTPMPERSFYVDPQVGVEFAGQTVFYARTAATGDELWVTDGTPAGTQLLLDIEPGPGHSFPRSFVELDGLLYFAATDSTHGRELWRTDGTSAGTQLVGDLVPGPEGLLEETYTEARRDSEVTSRIVAYAGQLFFRGTTPGQGDELWSSDGTAAGTNLLVDIWPGPNSGRPSYLTPTSLGLFFGADSGSVGDEPWVTDGTLAGTKLLKNINPIPGGDSAPLGFAEVAGRVVFSASAHLIGRELYSTQGTAASTVLIEIEAGNSSSNPSVVEGVTLGGTFYFSARSSATSYEIWQTDGTVQGTSLAAELNPGSQTSVPSALKLVNGRAVFTALTPQGYRLWAIDGAGGFTDLGGFVNAVAFRSLAQGGLLYVFASAEYGGAVARTDGTPGGTVVLNMPANFDPDRALPLPGNEVLVVADSAALGSEPYLTGPTASGLTLFADLNTGQATGGAAVQDVTAVGPRELYFTATDSVAGPEAQAAYRWSEADGAVRLVGPPAIPTAPAWRDTTGGYTPFFTGTELLVGFTAGSLFRDQVWVTDGSAAGTIRVAGEASFPGFTRVEELVAAGSRLYFTAEVAPSSTRHLFVTDGTPAGTQELTTYQDAGNAVPFDGPSGLTPYLDGVVFGSSAGDVLWSDGTPANTVRTHAPVADYTQPQAFEVARGQVAFFAKADAIPQRWELRVADLSGSTLLKTFDAPGNNNLIAPFLTHIGPDLYFHYRFGLVTSIYRTDLTPAGTVVVQTKGGVPEPVAAETIHVGTVPMVVWRYPINDTRAFNGAALIELDVASVPVLETELLGPGPSSTLAGGGAYQLDAPDYISGRVTFAPFVGAPMTSWTARELGQLASNNERLRDPTLLGGDLYMVFDDLYGAGEELYRSPLQSAYVRDLDVNGSSFQIEASNPIVGGAVRISGLGAPASAVSALYLSGVLTTPVTAGTLPTTPLWLEPAGLRLVSIQAGDAWTLLTQVPPSPALVGKQFGLQAGFPDPQTGLIHASNALVLGLGL